jgi:outer membrane receptor protein involved in Fe transport
MPIRVHGRFALSIAVLAVGALAVPLEASAQIEEVVVTARKRNENLQDVPMVVTSLSAETIQRKGIADLADIAKYSSGVMLDQGFNRQDTRVVIRGLSPTRGRQNVAILQDDVDISSLAQATAGGSFVINPRLLDVERIEVVKGPHSALYGRSAFNGAINYVTRTPGDDFRANVELGVASYDEQQARFSVSGPVIAGKLSVGLNAAGWSADGFYKSPTTGKGLGGGDGWGVALSLKATPNDNLTITARSELSNDDFAPDATAYRNPTLVPLPAVALQPANGLPAVISPANPANASFPQGVGSLGNASGFGIPSPSRNPRTGKDYPGATRDIFRTTLRIEAQLGPVRLTSITHRGDNATFQFEDALAIGDMQSLAVSGGQETYFDTDIDLFTQELRLQSSGENRLVWTVGALYWKEDLTQLNRALRCASNSGGCWGVYAAVGSTPRTPFEDVTDRSTTHKSVYGLAEFSFTEKLKASLELRYTDEQEKTAGFSVLSPAILGCPNVTVTGRRVNADGTVSCVTPGPQVSGPLTASGYISEDLPSNGLAPVVTSKFTTPRLTVDYKLSDDALVYVSAAQGKKPGGVSSINGIQNLAGNIYDPEEMWAYEIGAKTSWLENRLQVNGAVYFQDYDKKQVSITFVNPNSLPTPNQLATRVVNAAAAEVKGFEIEVVAAPTDHLNLSASYTYNDGTYKDFSDLQNGVSALSRAVINNPDACTVVPVLVGTAQQNRCLLSYAGNELEGAARHSLVASAGLDGSFANGRDWFAEVDARYQSSRFTSFENSQSMDAFTLADIRFGVKGDNWNATVYVNNVFDDDTMKASAVAIQNWDLAYLTNSGRTPIATQAPSGAKALLPDRRQYGLRVSYDF